MPNSFFNRASATDFAVPAAFRCTNGAPDRDRTAATARLPAACCSASTG
jgi:hypothetical protein